MDNVKQRRQEAQLCSEGHAGAERPTLRMLCVVFKRGITGSETLDTMQLHCEQER